MSAATITIAHFKPADVPEELHAKLLALTLPDGELSKVYLTCRDARRRDWVGHVIVAMKGCEPIGWALRWQCFAGGSWSVFLFVHPEYRRQHIGQQLVSAARYRLRRSTHLIGHKWDDPGSHAFWGIQHERGRITHCR